MSLQMAGRIFPVCGCTWDVPGPKWTICASPGGQVTETYGLAAKEVPLETIVVFFL